MKDSTAYITDKSGNKYFTETTGVAFIGSVKRDLQRHLDNAKKHPKFYKFLDIETAKIVVE